MIETKERLSDSDVGRSVMFQYNGKHRRGKVESVKPKCFTIELPESVVNSKGNKYSSFSFAKLETKLVLM